MLVTFTAAGRVRVRTCVTTVGTGSRASCQHRPALCGLLGNAPSSSHWELGQPKEFLLPPERGLNGTMKPRPPRPVPVFETP